MLVRMPDTSSRGASRKSTVILLYNFLLSRSKSIGNTGNQSRQFLAKHRQILVTRRAEPLWKYPQAKGGLPSTFSMMMRKNLSPDIVGQVMR